MPTARPFAQVDVFSATPYLGNPVAVVLDGTSLHDEQMQRVVRWTNLSETTFVLPPTDPAADYRLRILTPGGELPFAGHPTLGSAHAWLEHGGSPSARAWWCSSARPGSSRSDLVTCCPSPRHRPGAPVTSSRSTWTRW